jgi:hypothetical protein
MGFQAAGAGVLDVFYGGARKVFRAQRPHGAKKFLGGTIKNSQVHRPSCLKDHSFV